MLDRRQLLLGPAAAAVALSPPPAWAEGGGFPQRRAVDIVFIHTGEKYKGFYYWDGSYILPAVQQFSWVCRDFRASQWKWLNPWLMDLLFVLHWKYDKSQIQIWSGYRTPETNAQLEGAALNSQHIRANALDIHIPDLEADSIAESFKTFLGGGVGMYPGRGFTHMDFGPIRNWVG